MEMPPVSKVTALPTSPSTSPGRAGVAGRYRITIMRAGSSDPRATPSSAPAPSFSSFEGPRTVTLRPGMPSASSFA